MPRVEETRIPHSFGWRPRNPDGHWRVDTKVGGALWQVLHGTLFRVGLVERFAGVLLGGDSGRLGSLQLPPVRALYLFRQDINGDRFLQVVEGSKLAGLRLSRFGSVAAEYNHLDIGVGLFCLAQDLEAVHPGQPQIEHHDVWFHVFFYELQGLGAIRGRSRREVTELKTCGQSLAEAFLVVDDQYSQALHRGPAYL